MKELFISIFLGHVLFVYGCVDEDQAYDWYEDIDQDGYGNSFDTSPVHQAEDPSGSIQYSLDNSDCDDSDANNFPGNIEIDDDHDNNCDGIVEGEYPYGSTGPAGGIVFYTDDNWMSGLEAAPYDVSLGGLYTFDWGCIGINTEGAEGVDIGTGAQNTADIIDEGCYIHGGSGGENEKPVAARAASEFYFNGYSDWYLPSRNELYELYLARDLVGLNDSQFYWGSTENPVSPEDQAVYIWVVDDSLPEYWFKWADWNVRAIRSF